MVAVCALSFLRGAQAMVEVKACVRCSSVAAVDVDVALCVAVLALQALLLCFVASQLFLIDSNMFSLALAQVVVCSSALLEKTWVDPSMTHIDVRMEDHQFAQADSEAAFGGARLAGAALGTDGVATPAAFLSLVAPAGPLDAIVDVLQSAPVHLVEPDAQVQAASALIREVAAEVAPRSPFVRREIDPDLSGDRAFCDRDYSQLCPEGFANVGGALCAPLGSYDGPCVGEARSLSGLPVAAKERWSAQCAAAWPCKDCMRDFSAPCPQGWVVDAGAATCSPAAGYAGPCSGPISFAGYNAEMLRHFSSSCGAFWACSS